MSDKQTRVTYDNQFLVFAFDSTDLGGSDFVPQEIAAIPEPGTYALLLAGLGVLTEGGREALGLEGRGADEQTDEKKARNNAPARSGVSGAFHGCQGGLSLDSLRQPYGGAGLLCVVSGIVIHAGPLQNCFIFISRGVREGGIGPG